MELMLMHVEQGDTVMRCRFLKTSRGPLKR